MAPPEPKLTSKLPFFLLLLLITALLCGSVSAITIRFHDKALSGPALIDVYYVNGSHIGEYNTSSIIDLEESAIIYISPDRTRDYISEPMTLIDDLSLFARDNLVSIIILCLIIGFLVVRR